MLVGLLGGVVGTALVVVALWQPLRSVRQGLTDQIARHERALLMLQEQPEAASPVAATATLDERSLNVIVTESSAAFQLTIRRLEPEGNRIRVSLEDATFDALVLWLESLWGDHGLRVNEIEVSRRPAPGIVNATLTLER